MALAVSVNTTLAFAQTDTTLTYQGRLDDGGAPANGTYTLDFVLYDALSGGNSVGFWDTFTDHPVIDGLFTVELDFDDNFGLSAFDNTDRWIEIRVDGTILSPRQPVTRTPYAIQTRGIFVDINHNVGIGTSVPNTPLHVESDYINSVLAHNTAASGTGRALIAVAESTTGIGVLGKATATSGVNYGGRFETDSASGYAGAFFGGRNYFEGNVGIGIAPQSKLHIVHPAVGSGWGVRIETAATDNNEVGMRVSDDGFFDVTNKANEGSPNFARLNSAGVWTVISDRRMKNDIAPLAGVLDRAMRLDPVSYWYKNQDRTRLPGRQIGLVAQDVEPLFPSLVSQGGDLMTMDYSGLGVVAIAALQELKDQADIEMSQLRAENESLRSRVAQLEVLMAEFAVRKGIE
jgi:hypothetical protein